MSDAGPRKHEVVRVLRDHGWSFYAIARQVYGCRDHVECSRKAWQAAGLYRYSVNRDYMGSREKLYENRDYMPGLPKSNGWHAAISMGTRDPGYPKYINHLERRRSELQQLLLWFYNQTGLNNVDRDDKLILFTLKRISNHLLEHLDLARAYAHHLNNSMRASASSQALAWIFVSYELTLTGTPHYHFLRRVWKKILLLLPRQENKRRKKIEELEKEIARLEALATRIKLLLIS